MILPKRRLIMLKGKNKEEKPVSDVDVSWFLLLRSLLTFIPSFTVRG